MLLPLLVASNSFFFFFNDTATTEIYTLSLHDALPIFAPWVEGARVLDLYAGSGAMGLEALSRGAVSAVFVESDLDADRKSTRLNSSHSQISYAVFCLKKKKLGFPRQTRASASNP